MANIIMTNKDKKIDISKKLETLNFIPKKPYLICSYDSNNIYGIIYSKYKNIVDVYLRHKELKLIFIDNKIVVSSKKLSENTICKTKSIGEIIYNYIDNNYNDLYLIPVKNKIITLNDNDNVVISHYNGKYFVFKENNLKPLKIDFLFPNFTLIMDYKKDTVFKLEDVNVPYTYLDVNYNEDKLNFVGWIIPYGDDNDIITLPYPFNTSGQVCSNLNTFIKSRQRVNYIHWYAEQPNSDIPSIRPERISLLIYALKNNFFELLPFLYNYDNKEIKNKIKFNFKIKIVLYDKKKKIENEIKGSFDDFYVTKEYLKYFKDKYGNELNLEDVIKIKHYQRLF